ncbi:MAG: hypothetical protein RDA78_15600 [Roseibium sp.]|uniref:hypothetical protein n=1 Tax=Roseibium sp. TaxID=1936156 RepID=UPI003D9C1C25
MKAIIATFLSFFVFVNPTLAQIDDLPGHVVVGVRTDARPFVWWDESTKGFNGFVYSLCLKAVTHTGYMPAFVKVDSIARTKFLETGAGDYDLLCDPTTLTLSRAMHFADHSKSGNKSLGSLHFSPIYFVANGGHVELKAKSKIIGKGAFQIETEHLQKTNACVDAIKEVWAPSEIDQDARQARVSEDQSSQSRLKKWLNDNIQLRYHKPDEKIETPVTNVSVWGYVRGASIEKRVLSDQQESYEDRTTVCLHVFDTHEEAAARFCDGYLSRYYGDLDIIRATLLVASDTNSACEYEEASEQQRTYEPYAFVVSSGRYPDFPNKFAAALYALFHSNSVQDEHAASFPGVSTTTYLKTLFLINKVPSGESGGAASPIGDD